MAAIVRPTTTFIQERGVRDGSAIQTQFGMGANSATRPIWSAWADRYKMARAYLGYSQLERDGSDAITGLRRLTPMPHPDAEAGGSDDGPGNMFVARINGIKGHKALAGTSSTLETDINADIKKNAFAKAEIEVQYENLGYQVLTEDEMVDWPKNEQTRFFEILEPQASSSYITLPGGTLNYIKSGGGGPTGLPINYNVGKVFSTMQFKFMWHRLPYDLFNLDEPTEWQRRIWGDPDDDTVKPLIGTVNNAPWLGMPTGTLLLENVRPIPMNSPFYFVKEWNFEITWNYNPHKWNYLYFYPNSTSSDKGFYLVGSGTTYHAPGSEPDDYSLYNNGDHSLVVTVQDVP